MQIYIASKTKHAHMWRLLRDMTKMDIISTWIDEAGQGESKDLADLARRCITEAATADRLIVYAEEGETLKGAYIEIGAALAHNVPVYAVGPCLGETSCFRRHPLWHECETIDQALKASVGEGRAPTAPPTPTAGG